jgi:hypothetical protein
VVAKADITEATTAAATFPLEVAAAAVAGVGRFAAGAITVVFETSAFPDKKHPKNCLRWYELKEAPVPAPWHGTQLGEFSGWQEGAVGADSSRDTE